MGLRAKRITKRCFGVLIAIVFVALIMLPIALLLIRGERYLCTFEDGTTSRLSYAEAYELLSGFDEGGDILLVRDGVYGTVSTGEEAKVAFSILSTADLGELYAMHTDGVSRLERAALFHAFGDVLFLDGGESFSFDGSRVLRLNDTKEAHKAVLLGGRVTATQLKAIRARELELRTRAEFTAAALVGTVVEEVTAYEPYAASGNVVYRNTPSGRRLIAGLPNATFLEADCNFADRGALLPCVNIQSLVLPFVGSGDTVTTDFHGELAYLFSTASEYRVPETLARVRVTGGVLVSFAFYDCAGLTEIDACGVKAENIAEDAFMGLDLRLLHTPRKDVLLGGEYISCTAPCGCTVFEKGDRI